MDNVAFFLLIAMALLDVVIAAWFFGQGRKEGASTPGGRARFLTGGMMLLGGVFMTAIAFWLFSPFG